VNIERSSQVLGRYTQYLVSIFIWVGLSIYLLSNIDQNWWQYRDDSIINLSGAKNFALSGTIGLSYGSRVEAFSSPLNIALPILVYKLNPHLDFKEYLDLFVPFTLFLLALVMTWTLRKFFVGSRLDGAKIILINLATYSLAASSWTTFGWLISGMENILCVVLLVALIGTTATGPDSKYSTAIVIGLLGIARIEFFVLLVPIIVLITLNQITEKKKRLKFLSVILVIWTMTHIGRLIYFGHILPNTATALGKTLTIASGLYLVIQTLIVLTISIKPERLSDRLRSFKFLLAFFFLLVCISKAQEVDYAGIYRLVFLASLISAAGINLLLLSKSRTFTFHHLLAWSMVLMPLNHYVLFGPARLSAFRIAVIFLIPIVLLGIILITERYSRNYSRIFVLLFLTVIAISAIVLSKIDYTRNLCCSINPSDTKIRSVADDYFPNVGEAKPKVIVANPDIGKVSFTKEYVNLDLGLIGEPLLARIARSTPELVETYIVDYTSPDIFEVHGFWSCIYEPVLNSEKFKTNWEVRWRGQVSNEFNVPQQLQCPEKGVYTIWGKKISSKEDSLSVFLALGKAKPIIQRVNSEIQECLQIGEKNYRCEYVARAILRNRATLLERNLLSDALDALRPSPSFEFDKLRISEPRAWQIKAQKEFLKLVR
jgi:hypothetical protein